jgi:RNA polymerase sigma-70 factor (ECF subfamily)
MPRSDDTSVIEGLVDRLRRGDVSAREALIGCAYRRLELLTRKMLKGCPGVARWEETDDVVQNALIRMDRALKTVAPASARDFFRLAAAQVRRELIDLARHYYGPRGMGVHQQTQAGQVDRTDPAGLAPPMTDTTYEPVRLAAWAEFHSAIEGLAEADRELFDLLWYQGLTQAEAGAILGVSERTVNSRWLVARVRLTDALGGQLPI